MYFSGKKSFDYLLIIFMQFTLDFMLSILTIAFNFNFLCRIFKIYWRALSHQHNFIWMLFQSNFLVSNTKFQKQTQKYLYVVMWFVSRVKNNTLGYFISGKKNWEPRLRVTWDGFPNGDFDLLLKTGQTLISQLLIKLCIHWLNWDDHLYRPTGNDYWERQIT